MALRNLEKMRTANDGSRSLFESAMLAELPAVLQDWSNSGTDGVLIGGKTGRIDLSDFPLLSDRIWAYEGLIEMAKTDPESPTETLFEDGD